MVKVEKNFKAPLNREDFAEALKKGLGRALLHVKHHGLKNIEDLVLNACLHNQAYDPQCESSRAEWLWGMIKNRQEFPVFRNKILNALKKEKYHHDLQELFQFAKLMAQQGDNDAHQQLRNRVLDVATNSSEYDSFGAEELVELDGVEGLLDLARIYGQRLLNDPEDYVVKFLLKYGGDENEEAFKTVLIQQAEYDPSIKAYKDYLQRNGVLEPPNTRPTDREASFQQRKEQFRQKYTLKRIIEDARNGIGEGDYIYMQFGQFATARELEKIYSQFLKEKNESVQLRLLWVFAGTPMPRLDRRLFKLATGTKDSLRKASIASLAQFSDKQVHKLARQKVQKGELLGPDENVLNLFIRNYQEGDAHLIAQALNRISPDKYEAHHLGGSIIHLTDQYDLSSRFPLRRIYKEKHYDDQTLAKPLIWVYENTPCSLCRHDSVVNLDKLNQLKDSIIYECLFDVDEETRAFAQKLCQ